MSYFKEHFAAGDEVEFVVGEGQKSNNVVGQQVTLPLFSGCYQKAFLLSFDQNLTFCFITAMLLCY